MGARRNPDELTGRERMLIEACIANQTATYDDLAKIIGVSGKQMIAVMLKRPRVAKGLKKAKEQHTAEVIKKEAKDAVQRSQMSRADIIAEYEAIVLDKNNKVSDRRAALRDLGEIKGMFVKQTRDVTDDMKDWTDDELEHYARTGERPKRLLAGAGVRQTLN